MPIRDNVDLSQVQKPRREDPVPKGKDTGAGKKTDKVGSVPDGKSILFGKPIDVPPEMSEEERREMVKWLAESKEGSKGIEFLRWLTGKANKYSGRKLPKDHYPGGPRK